MTISNLIEQLIEIQKEYGDLDVHAVLGTQEHLVSDAGYAEEGPLPNIADLSKQEDLPERAVITLKQI